MLFKIIRNIIPVNCVQTWSKPMTCSACETFNLYTHEPELMSSSLQEHPTKTEGSVNCSVNIIQHVCFLYSCVRLCFSHRNIRALFRGWWVLI